MQEARSIAAGTAAVLTLLAGACAGESLGRFGAMGRAQVAAITAAAEARLTEREAEQGLRELLAIAIAGAAGRLGAPDGHYADPGMRVPLPEFLAAARERLKDFGMAEPFDALELSLNRAAEAASPQLRALLLAEVRSLAFDDALGLVRGGDTAAGVFVRQRTEAALRAGLYPIMDEALAAAGAYDKLDEAMKNMPLRALAGNLRKELAEHVVKAALDAAFKAMAEEERAIRTIAARQTTPALAKAFGPPG